MFLPRHVRLFPARKHLVSWLLHTVAALDPAHVAAAVTFAAEHRLRLVVKGTGHDYYGRSTAPDSLQVCTAATQHCTCCRCGPTT